MIRPLELFVGLRYVRARRRDHFISFISLISILGITLGVAALITVLSVMNGFGKELRSRILGVVSHVTITGVDGRLDAWPKIEDRVRAVPDVVGMAPYIVGEAMVAHAGAAGGVVARGILPEREDAVSDIGGKMIEGNLAALKSGQFGIVVGVALARKLDLNVGSLISVIVPQAQATPAGLLPRFRRFTVVGIFDVDEYEYDSGLVLIHLDDAATLYRFAAGEVSGLRLKLDDLDKARAVALKIENVLGPSYVARDWTRERANFFRALETEKTVMFVILFFIVTVAMFNLISTLVVIVTEKQSDIAILRTLGVKPRGVMGIFMVQGALIGVVGTLAGVACGVLLALNVQSLVHGLEQLLHMTFLPANVYLISELPSQLQWSDVAVVAATSLSLALLSTLYPAWRASKLQPAAALRYE